MADRKRSSGDMGGRAGCLFWLLLICVVLLLFLVNMGKIKETLASTNFNEIVKTQRSDGDSVSPPVERAPKVEDTPAKEPAPTPANPQAIAPAASSEKPSAPKTSMPSATIEPAAPPPPPLPSTPPEGSAPKPSPKPTKPAAQPAKPPVRTRSAYLYFVRIDDDGVIVRQEVKRQVQASDQPLTDALSALISGPSEEELRRHLISLVPEGTKLLSAQVRGSTAYLNFNEAFMYNHYGIEGYAGQLKQIVYTATAFSSVLDVQILIEGERHDYLGGEGVYIGRPLSRNSF